MLINELLIVTSQPVAPAGLAWAQSCPGVSVETYDELRAGVFDTSAYIRAAADAFDNSADGISNFYVEPVTLERRELKATILDWLNDHPASDLDAERPVAILGSYGMGKSSFALNLTSELAKIAQTDYTARIPILLRLGDISYEQKLEGLLGAHFTTTNNVPNYSFNTFLELVRLKRFLLIFDGFDEMKQMISWTEFKHNIGEINRLASIDSKVIILGRPNTFETDEEQNEALHGLETIAGRHARIPNSIDYQEIHVAPFNKGQIEKFVDAYLKYSQNINPRSEASQDIWGQINSEKLRDLAKRPVQLRMLIDTIPDRSDDSNWDIPTLYDSFVDYIIKQIIRREEEKKSRLRFTATERRKFLSELAYWMWTTHESRFAVDEQIPDSIIKPYAGSDPLGAVRRDLLAAAPVERRLNERIRFPHRSIQEFLVAEQVWHRLLDGSLSVSEFEDFANDEIAEFVQLLARENHRKFVAEYLQSYTGALSLRAVKSVFIDTVLEQGRRAAYKHARPAWDLFICGALEYIQGDRDADTNNTIAECEVTNLSSLDALLLKLYLLLIRSGGSPSDKDASLENLISAAFSTVGDDEAFSNEQFSKRPRRRQSKQEDFPLREEGTNENVLREARQMKLISLGEFADAFIGDGRAATPRLGIYPRRKGRIKVFPVKGGKSSLGVIGADSTVVRWLPLEAIVIAKAVNNATNAMDFRGAERMLINRLSAIAYLSDWDIYETRRPKVRVRSNLSDELVSRARAISEAFDIYSELRPAAAEALRRLTSEPRGHSRPETWDSRRV